MNSYYYSFGGADNKLPEVTSTSITVPIVEKKLEDYVGDKKIFLESAYMLSHLIIASLLVVFLKKYKPIVLSGLLSSMVIYLTFTEKDNLPVYLLPLSGITIYIIDTFIMSRYYCESQMSQSLFQQIQDTIWRLPYWSIISYYVIISFKYTNNMINK